LNGVDENSVRAELLVGVVLKATQTTLHRGWYVDWLWSAHDGFTQGIIWASNHASKRGTEEDRVKLFRTKVSFVWSLTVSSKDALYFLDKFHAREALFP
jgi:hypothetical protein